MKEELGPQVKKKRLGKIIGFLLGGWLLLVALLFIALQFSPVQTFFVQQIADYLNKKTGYPITIEQVALNWIDELELRGVAIYDDKDSLMIGIDRAVVDFSLKGLLDAEQPGLDAIDLNKPEIYLYKNSADSGLNINGFIRNLRDLLPTPKNKRKKRLPFTIDKVNLIQGQFAFHHPFKDSLAEGFDFNHFKITDINATTEDFLFFADTVALGINFLSAYIPAQDFTIDTLQTDYLYSNTGMYFDNLLLKAGNSTLTDSLAFSYRDQASLDYFQDSVSIAIDFKNSYLESKDIKLFIPPLGAYEDAYRLSGKFRGKIGRFTIKDLNARFGNQSLVTGEVSIDGLPKVQEAFLEIELDDSRLLPADLQPYLPEAFVKNLNILGETRFSGQFLGFPNDFVANGVFYTALGLIRSDINLKLAPETVNSTYSGSLALTNFDLGTFIGESKVGKIDLKGSVEGKGLTVNSAQLKLDAQVPSLHLNNYTYRDITAKGNLAQRYFEGQLNINDKNLKLGGTTTVDLRNSKSHIAVNARLDTVRLSAIGLLKDTLNIKGDINLDMYGLKLDEITGESTIANLSVQYKNRLLNLDTLSVASAQDSANHTLNINNDLLDLQIKGNWEYETVVRDFQRLFREYKLNFENDREAIAAYYEAKEQPDVYDKYRLQYNLKLKNPNPLFQLLYPKAYLSENTSVAGSFTGGYTSIFTANTQIDTLVWDQHWLYDIQADLNTSKIADSTSVLASAYIFSGLQQIEGATETENLEAEAIWNEDHMEVYARAQQVEGDNYAQVETDLYFLSNRTLVSFKTLQAKLLDNIWEVDGNNEITITKEQIRFSDLNLIHDQQKLLIEGVLSSNPYDTLKVLLENIELANINPVLDKKLGGKLNGKLLFQEVFNQPVYSGNLSVDSLTLNNFLAGDFVLDGNWNAIEQKLYTNLEGWRKQVKIINATGYYNPDAPDNQLNLEAQLTEVPINLLEPFFGSMFSKIKGKASGNILVLGSPKQPVLKGKCQVEKGEFLINYLNTAYAFEGDIIFRESEINFRQIQLKDIDGNSALLKGGIFHDGFSNFVIGLDAQLENTQVLNTTFEDNTLYYGTAYATGKVEVLGPANNLTISANAKSEKGTKIYIPINFENTLSGSDFINFVTHTDSTAKAGLSRQKTNITGIKLDFDLDITEDAYCEIIFDLRAGDIIRGRGNGKLELNIDTEGNFDMFGTYEITQGAYNFTLFNVITKEFLIEPGSTIRWLGDPYAGLLDIQAQYQQYASLSPLVPETSTGIQVPNRPYPVNLQMELTGDLMAPSINFDIDIPEYPAELSLDMMNVMSRLQNDEQLLNRQVFNLLVLRQFSPIDYSGFNNQNTNNSGFGSQAVGFGSQTAVSSISELLANQFSALASQIDQNLEIDVNFTSSIQEDAVNTFQLRLSYTFLDGRLRVTRDGSLASRQDRTNNNYLGDWIVEYRLTPDGQFRVKLFRRLANGQIISSFNNENAYTHGFSLLQTKSFNSLKELFKPDKEPEDKSLPLPKADSEPADLILFTPPENKKQSAN